MTSMDNRFNFACETAKQAGELALSYFNNLASLTVHSKGVQDMASEADTDTEALIRRAVEDHYPEDVFLGEESADEFKVQAGAGTWIVDPIDGTQPFVNGIRSWCISIAFVQAAQLQVGVVYDPNTNELFAAQRGKGTTLNGVPVHASSATSVLDGLVSVGYSNRVTPEDTLGPLARLMRADGMYCRSGSGALSLAYVAAGRLLGYFEPHMNSWDFAAGALLVREAGGQTNNCLPDEASYTSGGVILAGAAGVYAELKALVKCSG